jgi:ATP-dependent DNA helicase RecQ
VDNLSYVRDDAEYDEPRQIALYLTHKDVQLGYFRFTQPRMSGLHSGGALSIQEEGLGNARGDLVLKYSNSFKTTLDEKQKRGFKITAAKINFIVYWKDETMENEVKIILPKVLLKT